MRLLTTYTVSYDTESHWSVLTQMTGSLWGKVLPYCVFNVMLMLLLMHVDKEYLESINIEISPQGHTFVTLVVAFLLVSRVNIALSRYNTARDCLGVMYRASRELVQNMCAFTSGSLDEESKAWRIELAYRCLILLRTSMAVVDYPEDRLPAWRVPELKGFEKEDIRKSILLNPDLSHLAHATRSPWEETMRVPIRVAYLCRKTICSNKDRLKPPLTAGQEGSLLASVDSFLSGFYGIRKFLTTPVPFPLIQMARTFLFLYVFTVPFVLLSDQSSDVAHCFAVFLLTYGFMGLELVAIELDNPFGNDANDFDNNALALTAYEDTYLTVLDVDGIELANKLRDLMSPQDDDSINQNADENSKLLSNIV